MREKNKPIDWTYTYYESITAEQDMAVKYSKNPTLYLFSFHNFSQFLIKMSRFLSLSDVEKYKYPPFQYPRLKVWEVYVENGNHTWEK